MQLSPSTDIPQQVRIAYTEAPTLRERVLYKAGDMTRTTEIRPSSITLGEHIARHSISGGTKGYGNTALPVPFRLPLPNSLVQNARQRVLEAVAALRNAAPIEELKPHGSIYGTPKQSELWIDTQIVNDEQQTPWMGQRFSTNDPRVRDLLTAVRQEQIARSPYDYRGDDGQRIFDDKAQ